MSTRLFVYTSVITALLAGCASIKDTPNQKIQVLTPGATGARCVLRTDYAALVAYPPQTVFIRRMQEPLKVTCSAPGNREKIVFAYPLLNRSAAGNVATAGLTALYDHLSGALYEYPSKIVVDFSLTKASDRDLPKYHAPDTISPFDQVPEDLRPRHVPNSDEIRDGYRVDPAPMKPKQDTKATTSTPEPAAAVKTPPESPAAAPAPASSAPAKSPSSLP